MFNQFLKGQKKEEKIQKEKDEIKSKNFISAYEDLCKEWNRQVVPIANFNQNGIQLTLSTKKIKEDVLPALKKV